MGFLDNLGQSFGNMTNDPKQMGLLMAAAQMMAQSGPSNRPVSLGEIMGGGMSTFLNTRNGMQQMQAEQEEREQQKQYRGVQMQGLQMEQDKARQALAHANKVEAVLRGLRNPMMAGAMNKPAPLTSGTPSDGSQVPAPHAGPAYSHEEAQAAFLAASKAGMSDNYDPERLNKIMAMARQGIPVDESAGRLFGGAQQGQQSQSQTQESPYQRHMAAADALRKAGLEADALAYEDRALKFAPKVKNWQQVRVGDSVQFAPFFEDGSTGKPVPLEIARQMEVRDGGGTNDVIDPMTGKLVTQHRKTQSPDSIASNQISRERLAFDKSQAAAPIFNAEAGAFISRPTQQNPSGSVMPIAGFNRANKAAAEADAKRASSAKSLLPVIDQAEKLIDGATGSYFGAGLDQAARAFGGSTDGAKSIAQLKVLEGQIMLTQPRMEGPQSNHDVNLYRQMAATIGDPTVPNATKKAALGTLRELQQRYAGAQQGGASGDWDNNPKRKVVRTGTHNGRKVVQYSDGSTEYAD